jgi:hypothetical protein
MMGREKRAQLLLPSFVFVAAAAACGGTVEGEGGTGGATIATNPPAISYGGQIATNPPPIAYGGNSSGGNSSGGYGNVAGSTNPPPIAACPTTVPVNGSACVSSTPRSYECDYGTGDPCTTTLAWCMGGVWSLGGYAIDCSGYAGAGGGSPIGEGGAGGDGPAPDPLVYCPPAMPTAGAYCYKPSSVTSYRCDYASACDAYEATCNGQWQLLFHGSAADSCVGGASSN